MIFILGPHRSGTTLLHHLLAQSGHFDFVTAYDVICFEDLLANRQSGREAEVKAALANQLSVHRDRGLDGIPVGVDLPEEYGFILGLQLYKPRITPASLPRFQQLCERKRLLCPDDRPLLLKEPSEFYGNIRYLQETFPDARFIIMHRHPLNVLHSQVTAWKVALGARSRYGELISKEYARVMDTPDELERYRQAYASLAGHQWIMTHLLRGYEAWWRDDVGRLAFEETYENLCTAPRRVFSALSRYLRVPLSPPAADAIRTRPSVPSDLAREAYRLAHPALRPYLECFGYE